MKLGILLFSLLLINFPVLSAKAKLFRNSYVSFELPDKWNCEIEGTEWVCNSSFHQQAKEAVIILTAKEASPIDNLTTYQQNLEQPRLLPTNGGKPLRSKVIEVKRRKISGVQWVDGLHNGSEVPNYYTRYLATVQDGVAIIVSFSGHVKHYTKYSQDFFKAIQSLKVIADKNQFHTKPLAPIENTVSPYGNTAPPTTDPFAFSTEDFPEEESGSGKSSKGRQVLFLLIAVIAGYLYLRIKKKRK